MTTAEGADTTAEMTDEETCAAIAEISTKLGAEIIGEYGDKRGLDAKLVGFGAMHAAVFSFLRAGWSPDDIAGLAREHSVKVIADIASMCERV